MTIILIVLLVFALVSLGIALSSIYHTVATFDKVYANGVYVDKVHLGGMTQEQAKEHIEKQLTKNNQQITYVLTHNDKQISLTLEDFKPVYPIEEVLSEAFKEGHNETFFERYKIAKYGKAEPVYFELEPIFSTETIEKTLEEHASVFRIEPIDATIQRKNRKFHITPEKSGMALDVEATAQKLFAILSNEEQTSQTVEVTMMNVVPAVTQKDLAQVQTPIASFNTAYNNADQYRNKNLAIAAQKISRMLKPGEVFSLGEQLEPITPQAGYQPSKMILNGELVDSIGGGICQVASTLYNAVLLSELDIVTRANHSLPVAYVPLGRDATYATGSIDFKFKNNSDHLVFIESYCENNRVYVNIFGHESLKHPYDEVKFYSETIKTIDPPEPKEIEDPTLFEGERVQKTRPLQGKTVKLYKLCYQKGQLVHKELVNTSYYRPRAEVIRVGTKPREVSEEAVEQSFIETLGIDTIEVND